MSKYPIATKKRAEVVSPEPQRSELAELQPDRPRFFRLSSESFDGELAPDVYQQMLSQWQRLALSWLLPFSRRPE